MKSISAGKFKDRCLSIMAAVSKTKTPTVVTQRGRPVVRVIPYADTGETKADLAGSILQESGDPYRTGENWDADLS
jgi:prevent-host-death family protein